jgi:hypothetical protein
MLALFILTTFVGAGYLLYTSPVSSEEIKEMLDEERI